MQIRFSNHILGRPKSKGLGGQRPSGEGTRENRAPPCVKVPGSSRVPSPPCWAPDPRWSGGCTSHRGVLGSIPKQEEPGKTGCHPVLKYRVPHGSQYHKSSTIPLPPREQLCNRSCSNKHTQELGSRTPDAGTFMQVVVGAKSVEIMRHLRR